VDFTDETRDSVFAAAGRCRSTRKRVILDDPLEGRPAVEAAFAEWRAEWGDDAPVELRFTATGLPVFDCVAPKS
jgi:hypothetical protein